MNIGAIAVAIALPFLPWGVGAWFGFAAPPPLFFVFLAVATVAYLALVEISKAIFYRVLSGRSAAR
jgi:Mg2+-importing ATPase